MIRNFLRAAAAGAFLLVPASLVSALPTLAQTQASPDVTVGSLQIHGAFVRATLPNAPVGGAFLVITNKGSVDDRLVSASSAVAGVTQLHEMKMVGDVMKMAELPNGIPVPAGETVALAPGGLHIMLMQLKQPLKEGTMVPVTLVFEKAGTVTVDVAIAGFSAASAPGTAP